MFSKILIANRGEIAVRIIRACREMGIESLAVYSTADADALHVSLADDAVCIGPPQPKDSYLNMRAIITVAKAKGAQAIHPGYGFLSENADFADLCAENGITFIGPGGDVIRRMGDKETAKSTMKAAGVPTTPGCGIVPDVETAKREAEKIGYPLMIKATAGGGGKGIRIVNAPEELEKAFLTASAEAENAFGNGDCYLEKFLSPVKHIEVQLLCDSKGNIVCLGERECSVQRNNQKLLEESPSSAVTPELREKLYAAAVKAARAADYTNAGTVEFLLDKDNNFYFMEMNTRLQVEHPVTEMVTNIDLVKWQIRIAAGVPLNFEQKNVFIHGHSIECRINAVSGTNELNLLHIPGGFRVRFDTALYRGCTIPPYYDSMIGKLIVQAKTRDEAIRRMQSALGELIMVGVSNNVETELAIIGDKDFKSGNYYTDFMKTHFQG